MMNISEALGLADSGVMSFTGAGGKTTIIRHLSKELKLNGKKALITTTTHMYPEGCTVTDQDEDRLFDVLNSIPQRCFPIMCGRSIDSEGKLCGFGEGFIERLKNSGCFPYILVEADGSRGRPIKAFKSFEPAVIGCTDMHIVVVGLDSLGKPLNEEHAHRPEIISSITGFPYGSLMDEDMIVKLFKDDRGLLKGSRIGSRDIVILNKADDKKLIDRGYRLGEAILSECLKVKKVLISTGLNAGNVLQVMER